MKEGQPGTPGWTGRMDQIHAGAVDVGKVWATYHASMVENGMERPEATKVLIAYLAISNLTLTLKDIAKEQGK